NPVKEVLLKLNLPVYRYSIHTVKRSSRNRRIRRWRYNLISAESRFKTPCSNNQRYIQDESLSTCIKDFRKSLMYKLFLKRNIIDKINLSLTKGMSDERVGDDSKPRSYDMTFSNPLFDFNDDFILCNDNPLFDEEFKDISSLDPPESTLVIDDSSLLVTPLPDPKQICLRKVERFDPFFSLT
nr:NAC domain-containing protein [Tanacetum cinerariifolium]